MKPHEFGARLKAWRCQLSLTQDDLSARSRVPRQALSTYENGRATPTLRTAEKLAGALGLQGVGDLFDRTPSEVAEAVANRAERRRAAATSDE